MDKASPKEQQALADAFYTDLYNAAAKRCKMVTEPGPGTMRWRIALVDASSVSPFMNTLSTYEPHVHLLDILAGYAFNDGVAYWVGEATAEGYAKDATTGALLWQGQDKRAGTKAWGRATPSTPGTTSTMRSRHGRRSSRKGSASWVRARRRRRRDAGKLLFGRSPRPGGCRGRSTLSRRRSGPRLSRGGSLPAARRKRAKHASRLWPKEHNARRTFPWRI
jgi:hypothetical protein